MDLIVNYNLSTEQGYINLRKDYNVDKSPLKLLTLAFYAFNNLIRFNHSNEFNASYGKNELNYNKKKQEELDLMFNIIKKQNIIFSDLTFEQFDYSFLSENDFVYCDPPYLITDAVYNEKRNEFTGWDYKKEKALYDLLDELNERNIKWGLSNVLFHHEKTN